MIFQFLLTALECLALGGEAKLFIVLRDVITEISSYMFDPGAENMTLNRYLRNCYLDLNYIFFLMETYKLLFLFS